MKFAIDNVIDSWFDGITAAQVTEALAGLKDGETLELSINSPGGDVYEGIAIFNAIREVAKTHPVVVTINGLAASMASYIALAARTVDGNAVVKASDNSIFMIHNPYTGMYGDYKKFEKTASYLKQLAGALAGVYQSVSKKSEKDIRALMDETTFFVGNEIFENGFANEFEKHAATEQDDVAEESVQDAYMDFAMTKAQAQNRMDDNPPATHTEAAENNADEKALMAEFDKGFFGKE